MNDYMEGQVHQLLAEDPSIAELGVRVVRVDDGLMLVGEVESTARRAHILSAVQEAFPQLHVHSDLAVTRMGVPQEAEEI